MKKLYYEVVKNDTNLAICSWDDIDGEWRHLFNVSEVEVGSSVSTDTHTREVAEKAFEAAREGNGGYRTDVEYIPFEPKYKSFEDYLNSLNPEGK